MQIHQLNVQYHADQDRILARVSTTDQKEYRLWFTRRLCLGLLPPLRKVNAQQAQKTLDAEDSGLAAKDPKVREMLGEFQQQKQLQQADFQTPYAAPADAEAAEELLVTDLSMTTRPDGRTHIKFGSKPPGSPTQRELQLDLDTQLLAGLLHLLENAFEAAQWQGAEAPAQTKPAAEPEQSRPKYLN